MFDDRYLNQIRLLLRCLPEVAALQWKVLNVRKMEAGKRADALDKLTRVLGA